MPFGFVLLSVSGSARAEPQALELRLACEPALGPGRVRCSLEVRAPPKQRLTWVDALVVEAPSFARPLRARIPQRMAAGSATHAELPFALMATSVGQGRLTLRARAVLCRTGAGGNACRPISTEATLELRVGTPPLEKFARRLTPLISRTDEPSRSAALHDAR